MPVFLVTAGPTREYIDPLRFISNASSGKMGYAIAGEAAALGCRTMLVSGPVEIEKPEKTHIVRVTSALEMGRAVKKLLKRSDIFISSAAVADYRPSSVKHRKIKRLKKRISLDLVANPDILKEASKHKGRRVCVGFALETDNVLGNARKKLKTKNVDVIVANTADSVGSERSTVWLIGKDLKAVKIAGRTKKMVAKRIVNEAFGIWKSRKAGKAVR
ncbi:MAG: hypothetical protein JW803_00615 [Endomicrobiales bacterium]|nr:hypothetical protein [Endomicrobiales bacterium]